MINPSLCLIALYVHVSITAQLKQKASSTQTPSSSSSSMASSTSTAATKPAPPTPPAKEPFLRRYRFMLPMLLAVNLSIGGSSSTSLFHLIFCVCEIFHMI